MAVETKECIACGVKVWTVITVNHLRIPLEVTPSPDGTVVLVITKAGEKRARVLGGADLPAQGTAYLDHRRTCKSLTVNRKRAAGRAPKCRYCGFRLDSFLVERGANAHINCGPPPDLREALKPSAAGERGEALPAAEPDLMGGAW